MVTCSSGFASCLPNSPDPKTNILGLAYDPAMRTLYGVDH